MADTPVFNTLDFQSVNAIKNLPAPVDPGDPLRLADSSSGPTGVTGVTGVTGATGVSGVDGVTGVSGVDGVTGVTGIQGVTGNAGTDGVTGVTGVGGTDGVTGVTGDAGTDGVTGVTGVGGTDGITGITGITGLTGPAGPIVPADVDDLGAVEIATAEETEQGDVFGSKGPLATNPTNLLLRRTVPNQALVARPQSTLETSSSSSLDGAYIPKLYPAGNERGLYAVDLQSWIELDTQVASGIRAVAVGSRQTASGPTSLCVGTHGAGVANAAVGGYAAAFGTGANEADGYISLAAGYRNRASAHYDQAVGLFNYLEAGYGGVSSNCSFGNFNRIYGGAVDSVAVGRDNYIFGNRVGLASDRLVALGTGNYIKTRGTSVAVGVANKCVGSATEDSMTACGYFNKVYSDEGVALGFKNTVNTNCKRGVAVGYGNIINAGTGNEATAVGSQNQTRSSSQVFGNDLNAFGFRSLLAGYNSYSGVAGNWQCGVGNFNFVYGNYALAVGSYNYSGTYSNPVANTMIFGRNNKVEAAYGGCVGYKNRVLVGADRAWATGYQSVAAKPGEFVHNSLFFDDAASVATRAERGYHRLTGNVKTTDATVTDILSFTLTEGSAATIEVTLIGNESGGGNRAAYKRRALIYRDGAASAVVQGSVEALGTDVESDAAWDVGLVVSGNLVKAQVTGKAATSVNWTAVAEWAGIGETIN